MILNYRYDIVAIGVVVVCGIVGSIRIVASRRELNKYKYAILLILGGLAVILLSIYGNSYFNNRWDSEYIKEFLLFKRVSRSFFFRHICTLGYMFLIWGTTMLFAIMSNKKRTRGEP